MDVINIKNMSFDHIRLGFDQIVLEEEPYVYNERTMKLVDDDTRKILSPKLERIIKGEL